MDATRRGFLGAATAASYQRIAGANERVQVGFVGYGLIGAQHVFDFKNQRDADLAAVAEAYQPRLEQGVAACGGKAKAYADFRKLLDDREIQAVVLSLPDHWHALATIMACAAGKDVYVEKPMTLFAAEGRWMIRAARKYNRIVQVGTQQRSGPHYQKARELLRAGYIGKLISARMGAYRNIMPGFGTPAASAPPAGFDYDMWLGPAPARPFSPHRGIYHFRWFWDFSGGQMTNLAAHEIDIVQWVLGSEGPSQVSSMGGRFALQDDGETPDVQDALFRYQDFTSAWSHREASAGRRAAQGLEFFGTKGSMTVSRRGFEVFPDAKMNPANMIPVFRGAPAGGPERSEDQGEPWIQKIKEDGNPAQQFDLHARHFLDCIKTRQRPIADVEDGHRTAMACHLANISLRLGRGVRWNAASEQIEGDAQANAMLERPYRKPWDGVLRSLI